MRKLAACLVLLALLSAGCISGSEESLSASADERLSVFVPFPSIGDAARYAHESSPFTFSLAFEEPLDALDASGASVRLLPLRIHVTFIGQHAEMTEWYDVDGSKVLVTSPCSTPARGFMPERDWCERSDRAAASFAEYGLPGALGSSWLWGKTLRDGDTLHLNWTAGGRIEVLEYKVWFRDDCAEVEATTPPPDLRDQRFSGAILLPAQLSMCDGEPFPKNVRGPGLTADQEQMQAGNGSFGELGRALDPWRLAAHPDVAPLERGLPHGFSSERSNFTALDAADYLRTHDEAGRRFTSNMEWTIVRQSLATDESWGGDLVILGQKLVPGRNETTRDITLEGPDGQLLKSVLQHTCLRGECKTEVIEQSHSREEPSMHDPKNVRAIPLQLAASTAEPLFAREHPGVAIATGLFERDQEGIPSDGGFHFRFIGAPLEFGPAENVVVDGRTGVILRAMVGVEHVQRMTGLAKADL